MITDRRVQKRGSRQSDAKCIHLVKAHLGRFRKIYAEDGLREDGSYAAINLLKVEFVMVN